MQYGGQKLHIHKMLQGKKLTLAAKRTRAEQAGSDFLSSYKEVVSQAEVVVPAELVKQTRRTRTRKGPAPQLQAPPNLEADLDA